MNNKFTKLSARKGIDTHGLEESIVAYLRIARNNSIPEKEKGIEDIINNSGLFPVYIHFKILSYDYMAYNHDEHTMFFGVPNLQNSYDLTGNIKHELTHALDKSIKPNTLFNNDPNNPEYWNNPGEIRAYTGNLIRSLIRYVEVFNDEQPLSNQEFLEQVKTHVFDEFYTHVTPQNQRKILEMAYNALVSHDYIAN